MTTVLLALAFAASGVSASGLAPGNSPRAVERVQGILGQLPLHFEANRGQVDPAVRYYARTPEHTVYLTGEETVVQVGSEALRIRLLDSAKTPAIEGVGELQSYSSYALGNRPEAWQNRVEHFSKVRYRGVYPGIDLVYYGKGRQLEHDFVVAPGADADRIRMEFTGAGSMEIDAGGALVLDVGGSEMRFSAPYAYLDAPGGEQVEVASRYVMTGEREVAFAVGEYDRSLTLVIDPVLSYSTYFGGSFREIAKAVAVDAAGHIYVTGIAASLDYPTNGPPLQEGGGEKPNGFLIKLDPFAGAGGGVLFSGHFGGIQAEEPHAIALDSANNIYVVGQTDSSDYPTTSGAIQAFVPVGPEEGTSTRPNGFLTKWNLSADPHLQYSTYIGGTSQDVPYGLDVDDTGGAYVVGTTQSIEGFPLSPNPLQASNRGAGDVFLTIIDTVAGALAYSTYLGGTSTDRAYDVVLARPGTVFITGLTTSSDFPIAGAPYKGTPQGGGDAFLTQINYTNPGLDALGYSTYFGGSGLEIAHSMVMDPEGKFHIAGYTTSEDLPVTAAAVQESFGGVADIFVTTLDPGKPGGEGLFYSTYVGGAESDVPYRMALDSTGGLVVAGYTYSGDFPIAGDSLDDSYDGLTDGMFLRIDPNKPAGESFTCSSYFGGSHTDVIYGVAVDNLDNMYVVGSTWSDDYPITENGFLREKPGVVSAVVSKIGPCQASGSGDPGATEPPATTRRGTPKNNLGRASRGGGRGR